MLCVIISVDISIGHYLPPRSNFERKDRGVKGCSREIQLPGGYPSRFPDFHGIMRTE